MSRSRSPLRLLLLALAFALTLASALAQERHNFIAVGGELIEDVGPYYFISYGDSGNAFMRAAAFARAAELRLDFDDTNKTLVFTRGHERVAIDATADVREGLVKRAGVIRHGGGSIESPMAIIVDGVSYVPVTPIVAALGGESAWHPGARVITIDFPDPRSQAELAAPRTGITDGVSRVAIDVPAGHPFEVAVNGQTLALLLPGVRAPAFARELDDPNLLAVRFDAIDGVAALIVQTTFPLAAAGQGFQVGQLEREHNDVLFVDFAPGLNGQAATPLEEAEPRASVPPQPVAQTPSRRYTVVIDAGHGGRDPGAVADWATEAEIVLEVTLRLKALLEARGVNVILTRDDDTFLSLPQRSTFATTERNLFVSVHANAASNRGANGIETWVFGQPLDPRLVELAILENGGGDVGAARTAEAASIADDIAGDILRETQLNYSLALANVVQERLVGATGAVDRGVRQNLFYVIRNSRIPAILVEVGFVSHEEEGRRLMEASYQQKLARALADGIMEFLENGGIIAERR